MLLKERNQQAALEEIQVLLEQLQQQPSIEGIQKAEEKLSYLAFSNDAVSELRQRLANVKQNKAKREKAKKEVDDQIKLLADKLSQIHEACPTPTKDSAKSKKRKKGQQKPVVETDRRTQITELRKNVGELNTVILPALAKLEDELVAAQVEGSSQPKEQKAQAVELLQSLTVSLTWSNIQPNQTNICLGGTGA
jgi:hypothetical protein